MKRILTLAAASTAGLALATTATGHAACTKTFTRQMIVRAVHAEYRGARDVSARDRANVRRFIACARAGVSKPAMRRRQRSRRRAWSERRDPPMLGPVLASYYTEDGVGACGYGSVQFGYRFASLTLACGTWIRICHGSRCEDAEMADRGPYVGGRTYDLNANLRAALGCGGLCWVRWRLR